MPSLWNRATTRYFIGLASSAAFIALTMSRTDVTEVADAMLGAAPAGIVVALGLVCLEVAVRAYRWRLLLLAMRPVRYVDALGYLCVGYFANSLLPARLGDLARAYLAGSVLGVGRVATLGTIVIERMADAGTILLVVIAFGVLTPAAHQLLPMAFVLSVVGTVAVGVAVLVLLVLRRQDVQRVRVVQVARSLVRRLATGGTALRSPPNAFVFVLLTVAAFTLAVIAFGSVAAAVGLQLSFIDAVIVMGALALSTAIPAAPGAVGTYEFVGLTVLAHLGAPPEAALACVVLVHLAATLPPALAGMVTTWLLHVRINSFARVPE